MPRVRPSSPSPLVGTGHGPQSVRLGHRHRQMCPQGRSLPGFGRAGQDHRRGVRLRRIPDDPLPAGSRSGGACPRRAPGVRRPQQAPGGPRRGLGPGAVGPLQVHQAAADRGQEDSRHRPVRGPAADPLPARAGRMGLAAARRRARGGRLRPRRRGRTVRDEEGAGGQGPRAAHRSRHRGRHPPALADGAVEHAGLRSDARPDDDRSPRAAAFGGARVDGRRRHRPRHHQRPADLAAEHADRRQQLHQGPRSGPEADLRQGGATEAQCGPGGQRQGRVQCDEAGVQRVCLGTPAVAQLLHRLGSVGADRQDPPPRQRLEAQGARRLRRQAAQRRGPAVRHLPLPRGGRRHLSADLQRESAGVRDSVRPRPPGGAGSVDQHESPSRGDRPRAAHRVEEAVGRRGDGRPPRRVGAELPGNVLRLDDLLSRALCQRLPRG